jgi:hypothetical protein
MYCSGVLDCTSIISCCFARTTVQSCRVRVLALLIHCSVIALMVAIRSSSRGALRELKVKTGSPSL